MSVIQVSWATLTLNYEIVPALTSAEEEALLPFGFVAEGVDAAGNLYVDKGGSVGAQGAMTTGSVSITAPDPELGVIVDIVRASEEHRLHDAPDWRIAVLRWGSA